MLKHDSDTEKTRRRKTWLIQNTGLSIGNYSLATILTMAAIGAGITSIRPMDTLLLGVVGIGLSLIIIATIFARHRITARFSQVVLFGQYLVFMVIFWLWVLWLREARFISLFVVVISSLFLVIGANFIQSIIVIIIITLTYVGAVLYGTPRLSQTGPPVADLFMAGCFLLCGLMLSFIAGRFSRQGEGLRQAKRRTEEANEELWGEMQLARKIQTVLLPDKPAIDGFEITTYMKPADEVGGDYYDIINVEGRDWVIIGDVSGHGVPAGLIMMIVQTGIKIALAQSPTIEPSCLLSLINRTISRDIKKISEDKYMTITVMAFHDNGTFYFSGLHQDIMIYRVADKRVEVIATDGMWLGIMDNTDGLYRDDAATMKIGDIMLVFTDGITEAWEANANREELMSGRGMFGQDRLAGILEQHGASSPEEIKMAVLDLLADFTTMDDVTMVILKRLA